MEFSHFLVQLSVLLCSTVIPSLAYTRDGPIYLPQPQFNYPPPPHPPHHPPPHAPSFPHDFFDMRRDVGLGGPVMDENGNSMFSCKDRCDIRGQSQLPCQCNARCIEFGDCCQDYSEECLSCEGRCDFKFNRNFPCQCNTKCPKYNNCCNDHSKVCMIQSHNNNSRPHETTDLQGVVTDAQLAALSEELMTLDQQNNAASLIRINHQNRTFFSDTEDRAVNPLLVVDSTAYTKPSIAKLLMLHNNYVAGVNAAEVVTAQETQEETQFLDTILATPIMQKAERFLVDNNFIVTQRRTAEGRIRTSNRAFRDALIQHWFGLYTRAHGTLGSSGFEHIFLGETKAGQVSGFHNWVFFSKEEANNNLNYNGHLKVLRLGPKATIIKHKFRWIGNVKPVSTMFIGTSPEFELALYTVCFYARPNSKCPVTLYGKHINIQTHTINRQGMRFVGSAYPDI